MTKIEYDPIALSLSIKGHAGLAEAGKDIVCAGISTLAFTLIAALENRCIEHIVLDDDGSMFIKATPSICYRYTCMVILQTVIAGLEEIAKEYPEYVSIHTINHNEED